MKEQILLKNAPTKEVLKTVEEVAPDYMFMPIYMENDTASEMIESMNINYMGAELVFSTENAPVIQPEYIEAMHKKDVLCGEMPSFTIIKFLFLPDTPTMFP